jgi:hypothetical protein
MIFSGYLQEWKQSNYVQIVCVLLGAVGGVAIILLRPNFRRYFYIATKCPTLSVPHIANGGLTFECR